MNSKKITTISFLNAPEGVKLSIVYSELDEKGKVIKANLRENRILIDEEMLKYCEAIRNHAQFLID